MAGTTGTHSLADLLSATAAGQINEEQIAATLQAETAAANTAVDEQIRELCIITTDRERSYGTQASGEMNRADDFGRAQTQKGAQTGAVAFPFEKWIYATGWTEDFRRKASPAKYAEVFVGARRAYVRALQRGIRDAIFGSANFTFVDYMDSKLSLAVKRFLNADSAAVPEGPNGETFDGATHTHYMAIAALTLTAASNLVNTVIEHDNGRRLRVYINATDAETWAGLTGFVRAQPANIIVASDTSRTVQALDTRQLTNRLIGVLPNGGEVWTKPWVYSGYAVAFDLDAPGKPLALREDIPGSRALTLGQRLDTTPLSAQHYVARFGIGVNNRANGAVLDFTHASYTDPA